MAKGKGESLKRLAAKKEAKHEKREASREAARGRLSAAGIDTTNLKHPKRFEKWAMKKGPSRIRIGGIKAANEEFGYNKVPSAMEDYTLDQLREAQENPEGMVNEREGEAPTKGALSEYIGRRFNPVTGEIEGLNASEQAAIRGAGIEAIGSGASDAYRNEGERAAAAGIDPRSGVAAQRAMQIERGTQQARAGLERDITTENLARKQQYENLAAGQAGLEESGRVANVGANLRRIGDVEALGGGQERFGEGQRQYDYDLAEAQRQAEMARTAATRAGRLGKPSAVEITSGTIGGLLGGAGGGR